MGGFGGAEDAVSWLSTGFQPLFDDNLADFGPTSRLQ